MEYKVVGKYLEECMSLEGTPDIIMIDMGSISSIWNNDDRDYDRLEQFARKHTSSIITIMSYVNSWAEGTQEDLKNRLKDEVVTEIAENGDCGIAEYIFEKTLKYFPKNFPRRA